MIKKWIMALSFIVLLGAMTSSLTLADDDDDEYEYKYEEKEKKDKKYKKEHDDEYDDDDEYEKRGYNAPIPTATPWNIWTRDTQIIPAALPFTATGRVGVRDANNHTEEITVVVKEQELFVDANTMATLLNATAVIYPKSQLAEIKNNEVTLFFKSQTNVVYENLQKQPLPATTFMNGYKMYVPLRVITNALGYVFEWDAKAKQFYYYAL